MTMRKPPGAGARHGAVVSASAKSVGQCVPVLAQSGRRAEAVPSRQCSLGLCLTGDSSTNTGMEWAGSVEAFVAMRSPWWTVRHRRDAAVTALFTLQLCRLPSAASVGSILRIAGRRASGAAFRHVTRRGSQPRVGHASMRSLRCWTGRGRRRQAEYVGDDGLGGAQHRGEQRRQVDIRWPGGRRSTRRRRATAGCRSAG